MLKDRDDNKRTWNCWGAGGGPSGSWMLTSSLFISSAGSWSGLMVTALGTCRVVRIQIRVFIGHYIFNVSSPFTQANKDAKSLDRV